MDWRILLEYPAVVTGLLAAILVFKFVTGAAFGFTPWLDRNAGYYAILGMRIPNAEVGFLPELRQHLKPLIAEAVAQ